MDEPGIPYEAVPKILDDMLRGPRGQMVSLNVSILVQIIRSADGFCPTCARKLAEQLASHEPSVDWVRLVDDG